MKMLRFLTALALCVTISRAASASTGGAAEYLLSAGHATPGALLPRGALRARLVLLEACPPAEGELGRNVSFVFQDVELQPVMPALARALQQSHAWAVYGPDGRLLRLGGLHGAPQEARDFVAGVASQWQWAVPGAAGEVMHRAEREGGHTLRAAYTHLGTSRDGNVVLSKATEFISIAHHHQQRRGQRQLDSQVARAGRALLVLSSGGSRLLSLSANDTTEFHIELPEALRGSAGASGHVMESWLRAQLVRTRAPSGAEQALLGDADRCDGMDGLLRSVDVESMMRGHHVRSTDDEPLGATVLLQEMWTGPHAGRVDTPQHRDARASRADHFPRGMFTREQLDRMALSLLDPASARAAAAVPTALLQLRDKGARTQVHSKATGGAHHAHAVGSGSGMIASAAEVAAAKQSQLTALMDAVTTVHSLVTLLVDDSEETDFVSGLMDAVEGLRAAADALAPSSTGTDAQDQELFFALIYDRLLPFAAEGEGSFTMVVRHVDVLLGMLLGKEPPAVTRLSEAGQAKLAWVHATLAPLQQKLAAAFGKVEQLKGLLEGLGELTGALDNVTIAISELRATAFPDVPAETAAVQGAAPSPMERLEAIERAATRLSATVDAAKRVGDALEKAGTAAQGALAKAAASAKAVYDEWDTIIIGNLDSVLDITVASRTVSKSFGDPSLVRSTFVMHASLAIQSGAAEAGAGGGVPARSTSGGVGAMLANKEAVLIANASMQMEAFGQLGEVLSVSVAPTVSMAKGVTGYEPQMRLLGVELPLTFNSAALAEVLASVLVDKLIPALLTSDSVTVALASSTAGLVRRRVQGPDSPFRAAASSTSTSPPPALPVVDIVSTFSQALSAAAASNAAGGGALLAAAELAPKAAQALSAVAAGEPTDGLLAELVAIRDRHASNARPTVTGGSEGEALDETVDADSAAQAGWDTLPEHERIAAVLRSARDQVANQAAARGKTAAAVLNALAQLLSAVGGVTHSRVLPVSLVDGEAFAAAATAVTALVDSVPAGPGQQQAQEALRLLAAELVTQEELLQCTVGMSRAFLKKVQELLSPSEEVDAAPKIRGGGGSDDEDPEASQEAAKAPAVCEQKSLAQLLGVLKTFPTRKTQPPGAQLVTCTAWFKARTDNAKGSAEATALQQLWRAIAVPNAVVELAQAGCAVHGTVVSLSASPPDSVKTVLAEWTRVYKPLSDALASVSNGLQAFDMDRSSTALRTVTTIRNTVERMNTAITWIGEPTAASAQQMLSSLPASIRANVIAPTALQPHVFNAVALALHKQWRQDKSLDWLMKPDGHLVKSLQYMQAFAQSQAQRRVVRRRQVERNVALDSSVFRVLEFGYMMDDVAVLLEDTLTALELWQRQRQGVRARPALVGPETQVALARLTHKSVVALSLSDLGPDLQAARKTVVDGTTAMFDALASWKLSSLDSSTGPVPVGADAANVIRRVMELVGADLSNVLTTPPAPKIVQAPKGTTQRAAPRAQLSFTLHRDKLTSMVNTHRTVGERLPIVVQSMFDVMEAVQLAISATFVQDDAPVSLAQLDRASKELPTLLGALNTAHTNVAALQARLKYAPKRRQFVGEASAVAAQASALQAAAKAATDPVKAKSKPASEVIAKSIACSTYAVAKAWEEIRKPFDQVAVAGAGGNGCPLPAALQQLTDLPPGIPAADCAAHMNQHAADVQKLVSAVLTGAGSLRSAQVALLQSSCEALTLASSLHDAVQAVGAGTPGAVTTLQELTGITAQMVAEGKTTEVQATGGRLGALVLSQHLNAANTKLDAVLSLSKTHMRSMYFTTQPTFDLAKNAIISSALFAGTTLNKALADLIAKQQPDPSASAPDTALQCVGDRLPVLASLVQQPLFDADFEALSVTLHTIVFALPVYVRVNVLLNVHIQLDAGRCDATASVSAPYYAVAPVLDVSLRGGVAMGVGASLLNVELALQMDILGLRMPLQVDVSLQPAALSLALRPYLQAGGGIVTASASAFGYQCKRELFKWRGFRRQLASWCWNSNPSFAPCAQAGVQERHAPTSRSPGNALSRPDLSDQCTMCALVNRGWLLSHWVVECPITPARFEALAGMPDLSAVFMHASALPDAWNNLKATGTLHSLIVCGERFTRGAAGAWEYTAFVSAFNLDKLDRVGTPAWVEVRGSTASDGHTLAVAHTIKGPPDPLVKLSDELLLRSKLALSEPSKALGGSGRHALNTYTELPDAMLEVTTPNSPVKVVVAGKEHVATAGTLPKGGGTGLLFRRVHSTLRAASQRAQSLQAMEAEAAVHSMVAMRQFSGTKQCFQCNMLEGKLVCPRLGRRAPVFDKLSADFKRRDVVGDLCWGALTDNARKDALGIAARETSAGDFNTGSWVLVCDEQYDMARRRLTGFMVLSRLPATYVRLDIFVPAGGKEPVCEVHDVTETLATSAVPRERAVVQLHEQFDEQKAAHMQRTSPCLPVVKVDAGMRKEFAAQLGPDILRSMTEYTGMCYKCSLKGSSLDCAVGHAAQTERRRVARAEDKSGKAKAATAYASSNALLLAAVNAAKKHSDRTLKDGAALFAATNAEVYVCDEFLAFSKRGTPHLVGGHLCAAKGFARFCFSYQAQVTQLGANAPAFRSLSADAADSTHAYLFDKTRTAAGHDPALASGYQPLYAACSNAPAGVQL